MYKLGFFYNLPANVAKKNALFLCYENQGFRFYSFKKHMLPRKYQDIHSNYYSFCYPTICRIIDDEINDLYFIEDLPLLSDKKSKSPFKLIIEDNAGYRPFAKLYFGKKQFEEQFPLTENQEKLLELLTTCGAAKKRMAELNETCNYITPERYNWDDGSVMFDLLHKLHSIDLESVLSSLYVEVSDLYVHDRSECDWVYEVRRTAKLDENVIVDKYIKDLIGLGERVVVHQNYGYKCNEEKESLEFIQEHPLGVYKGRQLQREKKRILSKYSKECHMASLIFEEIGRQRKAEFIYRSWQLEALKCANCIDRNYTSRISSLQECLYYHMEYEYRDNFLPLINKTIDRAQRYPALTIWFLSADSDKCLDLESKIFSKVQSLLEKFNVRLIVGHQYQISQIVSKCRKEYLLEYYTWRKPYMNQRLSIEEQIDQSISTLMQYADKIYILGKVEDISGVTSKKIILKAKENKIPIEIV